MNSTTIAHEFRVARELIQSGRLAEAEALAARLNHANPGIPATLLACEIEEARRNFAGALDLVVALAAFLVWSYAEARRLSMRRWWVYPALSFGVAFAFAYPLFLFVRDRRMQALAGRGDQRTDARSATG